MSDTTENCFEFDETEMENLGTTRRFDTNNLHTLSYYEECVRLGINFGAADAVGEQLTLSLNKVFGIAAYDIYLKANENIILETKNYYLNAINHTVEIDNLEYILGSDFSLDVNGNYTTNVSGNYTVTIDGVSVITHNEDVALTINGNYTTTITGDNNVTITGESINTYDKNVTIAISGDSTINVTGDSDITYHNDASLAISGNFTTSVSGDCMVTITGDSELTYDKDAILTINGNYTTNIISDYNIIVNGVSVLTYDNDYTLNLNSENNFIKTNKISLINEDGDDIIKLLSDLAQSIIDGNTTATSDIKDLIDKFIIEEE